MGYRFTLEDYMFMDELAEEAIKEANHSKLNKIQNVRAKIRRSLSLDGKSEEVNEYLYKKEMTRD